MQYQFLTANLPIKPYEPPKNSSAIQSFPDLLCAIGILLLIALFPVAMAIGMRIIKQIVNYGVRDGLRAIIGDNSFYAKETLTPTQRYILAASSPTPGRKYKCVIDIWGTHTSEANRATVKELFEWGWGEFTRDNVMEMLDHCLNTGYNKKYEEYIYGTVVEATSLYDKFQQNLLAEMRQKYPRQGMLAWDLIRALSIAGSAYMGGIMEYEEAAGIAFEICKRLQTNFSSWDDMVGSYTLGYQFWRGKKKKDRLRYYKKLKRTWVYQIDWYTVLREDELGQFGK